MEEYQVHSEHSIMVPMRDSVRLAADIHRPAQDGQPLEGPFPVLLHRTPYGKSIEAAVSEASFFVSRGYVTVVQDCRGRYDSEGGFTKYIHEGPDGYDTLDWLAQQPWCNGKIGTFGLSYAAHTQTALACLKPPNLACMWLDSGGFSNAFHSGCRNGGAFELRQVTWAFRQAMESPATHQHPLVTKAALDRQDIHQWFQRMPWKKGHSPLQWTPEYEDFLLNMWTRETLDSYWQQVGLAADSYYGEFASVPQMHMGSWYDPYARSTTDNFVGLSRVKKAPVGLIMGPWTHGARSVTHSGDIDLGPLSTLDRNLDQDYNHLRGRFFDRWLKGIENGWGDEPPVRVFVMGGGSGQRNPDGRLDHGGRWRSEPEWPLVRAKNTPYYLQPDGGLALQVPQGIHPPSRYLFDPQHPVPTVGGSISSGEPVMVAGGYDQRESLEFHGSTPPYLPLASRPDVLVFQTVPLPQDLEVTGPISVHLWIASSVVDTDFTAKLLDVYPPSHDYPEGYALNLTDGILRAKFRETWERSRLLEPGAVYPITIQLYPTSNLFIHGHRIRVDISSSNFPRFDVNGNTGENPGTSPVKTPAQNSVFHDAEHPSHALLPILPVD